MGMDRTGAATQTLPNSTSYSQLTGMVARSGYGSTVITSDRLVIDANGTGTLRYNVAFTSTFGSGQNMRVVKNGTTVVDGPVVANTIRTSASISVSAGDTLELQAQANVGSGWQTVGSGNTTFLEYNQLTSTQQVNASRTRVWGISGTLGAQEVIGGTATESWGRLGTLSITGNISGTRTNNWGITGGIYKGAFLDLAGARPVNWGISGNILLVPKPTPLPSVFDVTEVSASVHTVDGRHIGDFPCRSISSFSWGREANEVSVCSFETATQADPELVEDLRPWIHWVTIWHDETSVWTGPIQGVKINSSVTTVSARDTATFMWRTRVPVTRTWVDTHTEDIALDLWVAMLQLHKIKVTPTVLSETVQKSFTISAKAEQRMLHQLMDDLVKVGLTWTVVAGRPVFGQFSRSPVVTLEECDFMVELERRRDGTATFNDVRVQGQNWAQNAVAELAGLNLQTLVAMDDMRGVGNIQRAALEYAQDSGRIRDQLVVPGSASLHHQAPVSLDDLVPGKVFTVHSGTISQLMRLDQVTVTGSSSGIDVQVGLVALEAQDDIARLVGGGSNA
jgi:hypothetical protein